MATRPRFPTDHEPTIEVRPAYGRFDDFATVVGTQRPDAGGCWCMSYRDSRVSNAERPGYMRTECETEPGPGVLVYVDDEVAGWCSIAPRSSYRRLLHSRTIPILDDADAWRAVCFVVRPGYRKHGLMHVCWPAPSSTPLPTGPRSSRATRSRPAAGRVDVISGYVGTVELFEAAGFERASATTGRSGGRPRWVMRLDLR